jgi:hypothetical protein
VTQTAPTRGASGSPAGFAAARLLRATSVGCVVVAVCIACAAARAAQSAQTLTLYSVATGEQFLNHSDDRVRGVGSNPFGNFQDSAGPTGKETNGNGPFPGDRSVFTFAIFGTSDQKSRIGSASFVCEYVFDKNAFCTTIYILQGGTLLGTGFLNFNGKTFTVSVTGGTGIYAGMTGHLQADPAVKLQQRLVVTLA